MQTPKIAVIGGGMTPSFSRRFSRSVPKSAWVWNSLSPRTRARTMRLWRRTSFEDGSERITPQVSGYRLVDTAGSVCEAAAVIIATPAHKAGSILVETGLNSTWAIWSSPSAFTPERAAFPGWPLPATPTGESAFPTASRAESPPQREVSAN